MAEMRKRYDKDHWIRSHDVERAFSAYMNQQSKVYSKVKNAHVRELLGDLSGKRFLDYGCGGGMFSVYAAKQGASRVVGVDAEESALATARYFARMEGVVHLCQFQVSERFPSFPPRTRFDAILMKDVIEHVRDDQALLDAAAEAIAPGGVIVLCTQNALSLNYAIEGTYQKIWLGNRNWCGWDPTHLRFYTPDRLETKLAKAGFSGFEWRSIYIIPYKLPALPGSGKQFIRIDPLSWIDRTLGKVFPFNRLGWNIIVRAEASPLVRVAARFRGRVGKEAPRLAALAPPTVIPSRIADPSRVARPTRCV